MKTGNIFTGLITDYALINRDIKVGVIVCVCGVVPAYVSIRFS